MSDAGLPIYLLAGLFLLVAFLYASVGLGGGSSYTALLVLFGAGIQVIPMISLSLNVLVTSVGSFVFFRYRHTQFKLIAPFLVSSIPMSYLGGALHLPKEIFYFILLTSLVFAAWRIYFPMNSRALALDPRGKFVLSIISGGVLGLVAGIVGIGGGIYLVPLIIILGLGTAKEAAACGTVFVWVNSVSGLISRLQYNSIDLIPYLPLFAAALAGGFFGSYMGSTRYTQQTMQKVLGSILIVAVFFMGKKIAAIFL